MFLVSWCLYAGCFVFGPETQPSAAPVRTSMRTAPSAELTRVRDELARASLSLDGAAIDAARDTLERLCAATPTDGWAHYYAAQAGYLGMMRAMDDATARRDATIFTRCRDAAVKHAREALERMSEKSEPSALLSAIHGLEIGRDPMLGMTLGSTSDELCERALTADAKNPRAWIVRGMALLFKPAFVGGSPAKAVEAFERAVELADAEAQRTDRDPLAPKWGRAEASCWLGRARTATGDLDGARAAYARALELEPEYGWVKQELLPALDKKIAERAPRPK